MGGFSGEILDKGELIGKPNACIAIISSRTRCLRACLESLYQGYNSQHDYPVYVLYFDDIYDSQEYRDEVHENISPNIHF